MVIQSGELGVIRKSTCSHAAMFYPRILQSIIQRSAVDGVGLRLAR